LTQYAIIGDIHGCFSELTRLIFNNHLYKRKLIFVGDLIDRGPASDNVLSFVMGLCRDDMARCVLGNHDDKLRRYLRGNKVQLSHGLDETVKQLDKSPLSGESISKFLEALPYSLALDEGKLVVAHGGLQQNLQGEVSGKAKKRARSMALYGKTTGKTDEYGYPERIDWAKDYRGEAVVVHGHTPCQEVIEKNNVWNIDTGCVFGNKLTALLYPEMVVVGVGAEDTYATHKSLLG